MYIKNVRTGGKSVRTEQGGRLGKTLSMTVKLAIVMPALNPLFKSLKNKIITILFNSHPIS